MAKHALLSPSSADRWMTCPGSVNLSLTQPDRVSEEAQEGTNYHTLAQICLEQGKSTDEFVGMPFEDETVVTEENAERLQVYLNLVRELETQGGLLVVEDSVPIAQITGEKDAVGTCDALIIRDEELVVIDLKFGRGVAVKAEGNRQTRMYALGALTKHDLWDVVKSVRLIICQPRVVDGVTEETVTIDQMKLFRDEVAVVAKPIVAALDTKEALPLYPSEKACRFCRAKAVCPELSKTVKQALEEGFEDLTKEIPEPVTPEKIDERANVLGEAMRIADLAEIYIKGVRSAVESTLLTGRPVTGFKLVRGRKGSRKWTDAAAVEQLMKSWRMKQEDMYDFSLISPTTAEKRLKKSNPKRWKRLSEGDEKEPKLIGQSDGNLTIAPADDPRPAAMFEKQDEGLVDETDVSDLF